MGRATTLKDGSPCASSSRLSVARSIIASDQSLERKTLRLGAISEPKVPRIEWAGHATYLENSHGASHLTAIRNAAPADGSTRKTWPAPLTGSATGKRRVTSIFEQTGISVST